MICRFIPFWKAVNSCVRAFSGIDGDQWSSRYKELIQTLFNPKLYSIIVICGCFSGIIFDLSQLSIDFMGPEVPMRAHWYYSHNFQYIFSCTYLQCSEGKMWASLWSHLTKYFFCRQSLRHTLSEKTLGPKMQYTSYALYLTSTKQWKITHLNTVEQSDRYFKLGKTSFYFPIALAFCLL